MNRVASFHFPCASLTPELIQEVGMQFETCETQCILYFKLKKKTPQRKILINEEGLLNLCFQFFCLSKIFLFFKFIFQLQLTYNIVLVSSV